METRDVYPSEKRTQFSRVKDTEGDDYLCSAEDLKRPGRATEDELKNCINESKIPHPFAGAKDHGTSRRSLCPSACSLEGPLRSRAGSIALISLMCRCRKICRESTDFRVHSVLL